MKTKLEKIGNSRGVCIPESLIEEARLDNEEIELQVVNSGILIKRSSYRPRQGWVEEARLMVERGEDGLVWDRPFEDPEWLEEMLADLEIGIGDSHSGFTNIEG